MKLCEIFDAKLKWQEKHTSTAGVKQYFFKYNDDKTGKSDTIWVIFTVSPHNPLVTHINFVSGAHMYDIANRGSGQFVILSTIIGIIEDYDRAYTPNEYRFEAKEKSRIKLYDRICDKVLESMGFERAPNTGSGVYVIYRV
jgi:hypothetical protein